MKSLNEIITLFEGRPISAAELIERTSTDFYRILLENGFCKISGNNVILSFVGFITTPKSTVAIFPKFAALSLRTSFEDDTDLFLQETGRFLLDIFKTYSRKANAASTLLSFSSNSNEDQNQLLLAEEVLEDFFEHGIWFPTSILIQEIPTNEVIWSKTVDEMTPLFTSSGVIYDKGFYPKNKIVHEDIVTQVQKWAINYCFRRFGKILNFIQLEYLDAALELDEIGEAAYVMKCLERQISATYHDRELKLFKNLHRLVVNENDPTGYSFYGHNRFEHIWENAVASLFNNEYGKYYHLFPRVVWRNNKVSINKDSVRPDILRLIHIRDKQTLLIIDAKYYILTFTESDVTSNPGAPDIVKQYFYELILRSESVGFPWNGSTTGFLNLFAFPSSVKFKDTLWDIQGDVRICNDFLSNEIHIVYLDSWKVFTDYIIGRTLMENEIKNFIDDLMKKRI